MDDGIDRTIYASVNTPVAAGRMVRVLPEEIVKAAEDRLA
jgi:hypothetical protein